MGQRRVIYKNLLPALFLLLVFSQSTFAKATFKSRYQPGSGQVRIMLYDRIPPFTIQNDAAWSRIVPEDASVPMSQTPDHPQLPEMEYWISVPEGAVLKDVSVKAQTETRLLEYPLMPVQKPYLYKPGITPPGLLADPQIYHAATEYPQTWYTYEIRRMGSTQVLVLRVHLFKYIGTQKILKIYQAPRIQVILDVPHWNTNTAPKNIVDQELKRQLVNPDEAFFNTPLR